MENCRSFKSFGFIYIYIYYVGFVQIFYLFYKKKIYFFYFTHSLLQNTHIGLFILHIYSIKYSFFTIFYYSLPHYPSLSWLILRYSRSTENGAPSSHIYGGPQHEFNERAPPWIWEDGALFSVLREYLRITREREG